MEFSNFLQSSLSKAAYKKNTGFSLLELLVVLAIIGVLTAIALPSYQAYVIKSRRAAVQSFMLDVANREKQYFLDARAYTSSLADLGISSLPSEVSGSYSFSSATGITVPTTAPPSFTITATAIGKQTVDGDLTLDSAGTKWPPNKW